MSDLVRSLRLFLGLIEQGNFSALARNRNVSHTTIARAIDDLEAHFGVRLFHRSTRRLTLTLDGERLAEHAVAIVDQVHLAEADLAGGAAARGVVRVGVTTALGLHYAQRLAGLREQHPDLSVELLVADWRDMADEGGLDLWLVVDQALQDKATLRLGLLARVMVAAPGYLQKRGTPRTTEELLDHDCLTYGYGARALPWVLNRRELSVHGFLRANSSEAVLRAVRGELGIGLLPRLQVEDDLARGSMVQLLPEADVPPVNVGVAHAFKGMRMPMRVQVTLDFLAAHFPG